MTLILLEDSMDKLDSNEQEKGREEGGLLGGVRKAFRGGTFARSSSLEGTLFDVFAALFAFLFARSHIIFGSHPLSLGFIAVLPSRVWLALFGSVIGSLTLGKHGIIYAMISVIVVFLRIIVFGNREKRGGRENPSARIFGESASSNERLGYWRLYFRSLRGFAFRLLSDNYAFRSCYAASASSLLLRLLGAFRLGYQLFGYLLFGQAYLFSVEAHGA